MAHTVYAASRPIPSPSAHGYAVVNGQQVDTSDWSFAWTGSAGSMASTIEDLEVYAQALASGSRLLTPSMQQQRLQFVSTNVPDLSYGLGVFRLGSFLGYDGEVPGYAAIMLYSPSQRVGLIVLGTADPALDLPPPTTKVLPLQVARSVYGIVFPGQSLASASGPG
jgi:D-alanyl-D-alanine carboxypeptidase